MKVGGKSNLLGQSLHKKRVDPPQDWFEKKKKKRKKKKKNMASVLLLCKANMDSVTSCQRDRLSYSFTYLAF